MIAMPTGTINCRPLIPLWLGAAVLIGLTWWHVFSLVGESRATEIATAERDLSNLTRVSQEHANQIIRSSDQVIRFIQSRYLEMGNKLNLTELTKTGVIDAEIFTQVGIIDAKGTYVLGNRPITETIDLTDREHFKVHVAANTDELFVSKPVRGRSTDKWSIQLTRRITRPNGEFAGVVVVSIAVDYFTRFYGDLKLGPQSLLALYGLDGVARVRKVGKKEEVGSNAANAFFLERIKQGQFEGSYTGSSVVDGIDRLYYYRKLPDYPLVVVAGQDTTQLLTNHRRAKEALFFQSGLVSLLILALVTLLTRYLRLVFREIRVRQIAQRQMENRNDQLNSIFELSPDGFVSFDTQRCVKYISPAFTQLTGQGDTELEGMNEDDFSVWLAQRCVPGASFIGITAMRAKILCGQDDKREVIKLSSPRNCVLQVHLRVSRSNQVSQILYMHDVTHETEVDHMKSEFLSTAAHELRTPMASILGFSELLLHEEFDAATQHEFLTTIYRQSTLMDQILNELLDLARIEARRDKDFRYTRVHLQELLVELIRSYRLPVGRANPELELPTRPLVLMADSGKVRQALLNVISNAYKYSPKGGAVHIKAWGRDEPDQPPAICIEISDRWYRHEPGAAKEGVRAFLRR